MKAFQKLLFLVSVFAFAGIGTASAATLYMDPNQAEIMRGDSVLISLHLDTDEEECVNAIDAIVKYSENIEPIDVSRGSSILSVWIEDPKIDKANRTITFAGGIPNGYCGRIPGDPRVTNNLVDISFMSPGLQIGTTESGNVAKIEFAPETRVLLNDGYGTEASRQLFGTELLLSRTAGPRVENDWLEIINNDDQPPEDFSISLERTPNAYSNKYFIVFNTTDKQSGIASYEVMEEPLELRNLFMWGRTGAPWVTAKSPYVLEDQSLNSTIRVRAIDKAGNEYIAVLVPDEANRTIPTEIFIFAGLVGVGVLILLIGIFLLVRYFIRRRRTVEDDEDANEEDAEE